jgi:hypothetical protein
LSVRLANTGWEGEGREGRETRQERVEKSTGGPEGLIAG